MWTNKLFTCKKNYLQKHSHIMCKLTYLKSDFKIHALHPLQHGFPHKLFGFSSDQDTVAFPGGVAAKEWKEGKMQMPGEQCKEARLPFAAVLFATFLRNIGSFRVQTEVEMLHNQIFYPSALKINRPQQAPFLDHESFFHKSVKLQFILTPILWVWF